MARKRAAIDLSLTSATDLFSTQEEREEARNTGIRSLPIDEIVGFKGHPFKVIDDDDMATLAESIQEVGVLVPIQVRPKGKRFELVSGHRRKRACELAGLVEIPAIVKDMTDDEAIIAMVDSNLQRERILPSERAFAYKLKLDAMKRQGKRTDLTSDPLGQKLKKSSVEQIAEDSGDSKTQVQRYIRLTYLVAPLLSIVDENKMGMRPAVEISYLTEDLQTELVDVIGQYQCTPSHVQAIKLRKFASEGSLSKAVMQSIMEEQKPNQAEAFRIPRKRISRFFAPDATASFIEKRIIKALELLEEVESGSPSISNSPRSKPRKG